MIPRITDREARHILPPFPCGPGGAAPPSPSCPRQKRHPHVPDAWIDPAKTVIGYEISFNKYFYAHQSLRDIEKEIGGLLEQILNFSSYFLLEPPAI